jgi:hypothetical protein
MNAIAAAVSAALAALALSACSAADPSQTSTENAGSELVTPESEPTARLVPVSAPTATHLLVPRPDGLRPAPVTSASPSEPQPQ